MNWLPLKSVRIENYKAIVDSGRLEFSPFTLLIGNNGSGKSSLIEALDALRSLGTETTDDAFVGPRAIEHVVNKAKKLGRVSESQDIARPSERLRFSGAGRLFSNDHLHGIGGGRDIPRDGIAFSFQTELATVRQGESLLITKEQLTSSSGKLERDSTGLIEITDRGEKTPSDARAISLTDSMLRFELGSYFTYWQILGLVPEHMGLPVPRRTALRSKTLLRDGSNVAEILNLLAHDNRDIFDSIVDTMRHILGYAERMDPRQDLGAIRNRFIELDEREFTVPGWMLSTGTLRIIALLIALRWPKSPTVICIEEIENGLDPRTLSLLLDEIKFRTESKKIQVIATTHSPYLLDQIELEQVMIVHRDDGQPKFLKPSNSEHVKAFVSRFDPGKLYTMGVLDKAVEELLG
ncbi:MAG: AAA family ATPase [Armatimonadetes bacterium]|nr:AAA family ATPase [Armatimonadota bacterium]